MRGSWGYFLQGQGEQEIDSAGSALSQHLSCKCCHYPAFNKRLFECKCGVIFPVWMVQAAIESNDWSLIDEKHEKEKLV